MRSACFNTNWTVALMVAPQLINVMVRVTALAFAQFRGIAHKGQWT